MQMNAKSMTSRIPALATGLTVVSAIPFAFQEAEVGA